MLGFRSSGLAPLSHSAVSIQLYPPPHGPVTGRTAMEYTFNHPRPGFKPSILDFRDLMKHA
eukprot:6604148-Ditylum_brightwellii.AAC.1